MGKCDIRATTNDNLL